MVLHPERERPTPTEVVLSLGGNLGDRADWLRQAREALTALPETLLAACSPIYESEPVDAPAACAALDYLNQVVIVTTRLAAPTFAAAIHLIEERLGRQRGARPNLPRTIDIDIIDFGGMVDDDPRLTLPHPRAQGRRFVLQPLADLRPGHVLPGTDRTVKELLCALPPAPRVRLFDVS